jgi:hypothetical protein
MRARRRVICHDRTLALEGVAAGSAMRSRSGRDRLQASRSSLPAADQCHAPRTGRVAALLLRVMTSTPPTIGTDLRAASATPEAQALLETRLQIGNRHQRLQAAAAAAAAAVVV